MKITSGRKLYVFNDYYNKVITALKKSAISKYIDYSSINTYQIDIDDDDISIEIHLKSPYVCSYYARKKWYCDIILIVPDSDWISNGAPEYYLVLDANLTLMQMVNRCNELEDQIKQFTKNYEHRRLNMKNSINFVDYSNTDANFLNLIDGLLYEVYDNYRGLSRIDASNIVQEHVDMLINEDLIDEDIEVPVNYEKIVQAYVNDHYDDYDWNDYD